MENSYKTKFKKAKKSKKSSQHSYSNLPDGQTALDRYVSETEAHEQFATEGFSQRQTGQQKVQQWNSAWNQASGSR